MVQRLEARHMAIGLQFAGKTTFAAALWYLIGAGETTTVLKKGKHTGDHSYLEILAGQWADGWEAPRTKLQDHQNITMNLRDAAGTTDIVLQFVDLGGETFERAFATRTLVSQVAEEFIGIENLMLFVNASQTRDDLTLLDFASGLGLGGEVSKSPDDDRDQIKFDPAKTPRQVQLVDFLQSIQQPPISTEIRRLVVIISAWDKGPPHGDPQRWLTETMPLLDQYLANSSIEVRVYGVSGQGGDLPNKDNPEKQKDRMKLLKLAKASNRIQIVGYGAQASDLTHPIRWLSGLEIE